ncbi:CCA tRNA nucleotidyltransferase [Candidatus Hepatobacter penaei]|uniref:CCA tRNA nucleotidyltransferase n=1 Tax=Candidatus Hepatobacter penaei TaxID=1274402 RepID=UPI000697A4F8|nr:CCA tRNA nucleotidyltransferase [Candidatus Hepatobacter penaei]TGW14871.1 CCA tRNA nucleotidyltransferase [bacterium NHP-B]
MNASFLKRLMAPHRPVLRALNVEGGEARFVGSFVRDGLLGHMSHDIDIATTHTPEDVCLLLGPQARIYKTGIKHGTITALWDEHTYEITTLRRDVNTDGRHADVAFTQQWEEDAARRDFTFNALYLDHEGHLYDYYGGQEDLAHKVVRFIGVPERRIREDYLRILRFFRFASRYGSSQFDEEGLSACLALKQGLTRLSQERIKGEMEKIFAGSLLTHIVPLFYRHGLFPLLGRHEVKSIDVWQSLFSLEQKASQRAPFEVQMHSLYGNNRPSFLLTRAEHTMYKALGFVIPPWAQEKAWPALWPLLLCDMPLDQAWAVVWLALAAHMSVGKLGVDEAFHILNAIAALNQTPPVFPVTGHDLIKLGVAPGPALGRVFQKTRDFWKKNDCEPSRDALLTWLQNEGLTPPRPR